MDDIFLPFLPGPPVKSNLPLARFLPPLPPGMVGAWLKNELKPGSWVLDPYGSAPNLALEAAAAGYRVLVVCNNPILCFMLEILASAPQQSDFQAALADLARERREGERLETHLQALYLTECEQCNQIIPAQSFLWRKNETLPYSRLYQCPHCGFENEARLTEKDIKRYQFIGADALHRSRAIKNLELQDEESIAGAKEALQSYSPRPLYFIFTLLNRLEKSNIESRSKQLLMALLLSAMDEGNSLWNWPATRSRPRQLNTPAQFRETNLWSAFENAATIWSNQKTALPITRWPEKPNGPGGICLYPGRLKNLSASDLGEIQAGLTVIPRPNQAFWTLSALWAGWFWGAKGSHPMKGALERRRYDWSWHTGALQHAFHILRQSFAPGFRFFTLLPELETGLITALFTSARLENFNLQGIALREEQNFAQIQWQSSQEPAAQTTSLDRNTALQFLAERNEPCSFTHIYINNLCMLSSQTPAGIKTLDAFKQLQNNAQAIFQTPGLLCRYQNESENLESGLWGLANPSGTDQVLPLRDRSRCTSGARTSGRTSGAAGTAR